MFYAAAAALLVLDQVLRRTARAHRDREPERDDSAEAHEASITRREHMRDRVDAAIVCAVLAALFAVAATAS